VAQLWYCSWRDSEKPRKRVWRVDVGPRIEPGACATNDRKRYGSCQPALSVLPENCLFLESKQSVFFVTNPAMGRWRYSSLIVNLGTRWRRLVSFMPRPQGKRARYSLDRRLETKLRGFSPPADYADRATAACWRS
jgi:hypothetical protein